MTEQDLADRLEKARRLADMFQEVAFDRRFSDEAVGIMCRSHVDEILASLRRSAPASGEMREAVLAECAAIARRVKEHYETMYGHATWKNKDRLGARKMTALEIENSILALASPRTPSGETREEAGS